LGEINKKLVSFLNKNMGAQLPKGFKVYEKVPGKAATGSYQFKFKFINENSPGEEKTYQDLIGNLKIVAQKSGLESPAFLRAIRETTRKGIPREYIVNFIESEFPAFAAKMEAILDPPSCRP